MRRLLFAVLGLLALAPATASAAPAVSGEFPTTGTLSGVPKHLAQGSDGNIWVVLDNNKIAKVTILEQPQSSQHDIEIGQFAFPVLISETLKAQSAHIDSVSGATYTSGGYVQSLQSAIDNGA